MSAIREERLRRLSRAAERASRRLRYGSGLRRAAFWLPLPLGFAASGLCLLKLVRLSPGQQALVLGVGATLFVLALAAILHGLLRRPARWAGALALDRHHRLQDRVTTALELSELPAAEQTAFTAAAIEDGLQSAPKLDVRRAVPVRLPRELGVSALLAALLVGVMWFEVRVERLLPPPPSFEPLVMAPDDLELFGEIGRQLAQKAEDPDSLAAIRRFNMLVEDIADKRLDRRAAFERLGELEAELSRRADADKEARELGLQGLARELARSNLSKPAAEALEQKRLADAEKALRELAERLKRKDKKPSAAELEKLRSAVERASRQSAERLSSIERRRQELDREKKSLLNKHKDVKTAERDPKVQENQRKLERLERDKKSADQAAREMSELDRQLAEAAEQLRKDQQKGAENIERSAESLNRMAKREMSDQQKRELLQRLREMRELLRQQGQGGAERQRQMARFGQRARGGQSSDGGQQQRGERKGDGQSQGVEVIEVPRIVQAPGPDSGRQGQGQGQGQPSNQGSPAERASGEKWGKGHDPNVAGDAKALRAGTEDVSAAGIDTGQGKASAEVIYGAADRGFVGKGYRDIFVEYQAVAEQALEHDQIPPGYRFYVRRYFQLIRPRE